MRNQNPMLATAIGAALAIAGVAAAPAIHAQQSTAQPSTTTQQPPASTPSSSLDRAGEHAQRSAERTGEAMQQGARAAGERTERAADRTAAAAERGMERTEQAAENAARDRTRTAEAPPTGSAQGTSDARDMTSPGATEPRSTRGDATTGSAYGSQAQGTTDATGRAPATTGDAARTAPGDTARTASADRSDARHKAAERGHWVLVPAAVAEGQQGMSQMVANRSSGCWVRLHTAENFAGDFITIVGPGDIGDLRAPFGMTRTSWESAIVGPEATVTTYEDTGQEDADRRLDPNQRYANLQGGLGWFRNIQSIRLNCDGQGEQNLRQAEAGASADGTG